MHARTKGFPRTVRQRGRKRRRCVLALERLEGRALLSAGITEYAVPTASSHPIGIVAGPDGNLWFTENATKTIGRITTDGTLTEYLLDSASSVNFEHITTGPDGALWFTEENVDEVGRIATTGTFTQLEATAAQDPEGIVTGPDGNLWITDEGKSRIIQLTTAGGVTAFQVPTASAGIESIVAAPDGALWFTEDAGKIGRVATDGTFNEYSIPTAGADPENMTVGPDGALWFTELDANRIGRVTTAGVFTEFVIPTANSSPCDITTGPDGALWFTEQTGNNIGRLTTTGVFTEYAIPTPASGPHGIAVGPDGNIWFTEYDADKIGVLPLDAALTAAGTDVRTSEGATFTGRVASFTDGDPRGTASQFSAVIDWGDGTTSAGTVAANASGGFDVTGSHRYAEEGSFPLNVVINDVGGSSATASSTARVTDTGLDAFNRSVSATEGWVFFGPLASFRDQDPGGTAGDYSATINWGDGTTTAGSITADAGGGFDVTGSHAYGEVGSYAVAVSIQDNGGATASAASTAVVADAPLSVTGLAIGTLTGSTFTGPVATFTDADPGGTAADYSVTINWGDGTTSAGTAVANASGGFDVIGSHQYATEGSYAIGTSIRDIGGATTTASSSATVADAPLSVTAVPVTATEGTLFRGTVASFTDLDPGATTGEYSATITWGDGTTSSGTVTANAAGGFDVVGSHAYAEEGSLAVGVTVRDTGGASVTTSGSATVADAPLHVVAAGVSATTGAPFSGVVGSFTDDDPGGSAGDYSVTINWGDGTTSPGTVVANGTGGFDVRGTHTYATEGSHAIALTAHDAGGAVATGTGGTATVGDAPLTGSGKTFSATEGQAFSGLVATFTDADPRATVGDYSATITWGDGATSAGTVTADATGGFNVTGGHVYTEEGSFAVAVAIHDAGGALVTTSGTATVADAPLHVVAADVSATVGAPFSGVIGSFTDDDPGGTVGDYSVTINWGDGTSSPGSVVANATGGFDVHGAHTYAAEGSYAIALTARDTGGAVVTGTGGTATVGDAPLTGSGQNFLATEGQAFSGVVVTFTDADPRATVGDYSATITWGDGATSAGTVTADATGGFNVTGGHVYTEEGSFAVAVAIHDAGGALVTTAGTATVADAPLHVVAAGVSATAGAPFSGVVGSFTDDNAAGTPGDYSVTIDWGDGTSSPGSVVANATGGFDVHGTHTYTAEGSYAIALTAHDAGGAVVTGAGGTATVGDAPLTGSGQTFPATEGQTFSGLVATFTDADPRGAVGDFSASITWGDGTTSAGSVTANAAGGFDVTGRHAYAEEGSFVVAVAIHDAGGAGVTTAGSATVADAPLHVIAAGVSTTAGTPFSGVVGSFTDDDPGGAAGDYSVIIDWGDGTSSPGTLVANAIGGFDVHGTHTYAAEGSYAIALTARDAGGAVVTGTDGTATVGDAPLTGSGQDFPATEGQTFSGLVATFTDADPRGAVGDFSATITWGDGATSAGTVTANATGGFNVTGSHAYAEEGSFAVAVAIHDAGGAAVTTAGSATVADAPLHVVAAGVSATAGAPFSSVVGSFTDDDPGGTASDYSVTINWGDGTSSPGTLVANAIGGFDVHGTHTYAVEGSYAIALTARDAGGTVVSGTGGTATVGDAPLTGLGQTFATTEGQTFSGLVANFTDADPRGTAGDYSATITWGDGATSAGTVTANATGGFNVTGTHAYAEEGSFAVAVAIHDVGGASVTTTGAVTVADAPLHVVAGSFNATAAAPFSGVVGSFTDGDPGGAVGDYNVTINWGDGTSSPGAVVANATGGFDVHGTHTYTAEGSYPISLTAADLGEAVATGLDGTATVADAPLTGSGQTLQATEGQAFSGLVATFTDADPRGTVSDYSATITWGDGATSAGTVTANAAGGFDLTGGHVYTEEGSFAVAVAIHDAGGASVTTAGTAVVADAPLHAVSASLSATAAATFQGVVGSFTDDDPAGVAGDHRVTIDWGDGTSSSGSVMSNTAGGFDVQGTHAYSREGSYSISLTVRDAGGAVAIGVGGTATVADAPLTGSGQVFPATEGEAFSDIVGTFTDADPNGTVGDYRATIDWGDGTSSAGLVKPNATGGFEVGGTHTYAEEGSFAVTATVRDVGGSFVTMTGRADVADAPLFVAAASIRATAGSPFSAVVGTFTDNNPGGTTDDHRVTINWGDGTSSAGSVVADAAGGFDIVGTHDYVTEGSYGLILTVHDVGGSVATSGNGIATVADAPLTGLGQTFAPTEGRLFSGLVASFTDADPNGKAGAFRVTIDWGDGTTSAGVVAANGTGGFAVTGSHAYDEEGNHPVAVHIQDAGGASITATSTAQVADAPLSVSGLPIQAVAGNGFTGPVASFTDADPSGTPGDYSARIDWGDGSSTVAAVAGNASGGFEVVGSHTYAVEGTYPIAVTVLDAGSAVATSSGGSATVADAPLTASAATINATEGLLFSGVAASFTDADPHAAVGDYRAIIDWGDGSSAVGTVSANGHGGFDVSGSHSYSEEGSFAVAVTVQDRGGASVSVNVNADVTDAPLTAVALPIEATAGALFRGTVAWFIDANPNGTVGDYRVTIDWGDGTASTGSVTPNSSGGFDVAGSHPYAVEGSYAVVVTVQDSGGAVAVSAGGTANVADAPLSASSLGIQTIEGSTFSGRVASFIDADPSGAANHYSAVIDWGDGTTAAATISANASGGFDVTGSHVYGEEGSYAFTVAIHDLGGASTSISATALVADAALSASGRDVHAVEGNALNAVVAAITDANPGATASDFSATITWGDGTTSAGTVVANAVGGFDVQGGHTYQEEGPYTIAITVQDAGGAAVAVSSVATVADAALSAMGTTIPSVEGALFIGRVATFTDANPVAASAEFTASINWGDGTTSAGTVAASGTGGFEVVGYHRYAEEGIYAVAVTIQDAGGTSVLVSSTARVIDAALQAAAAPVRAVEGNAFHGVVASFTDANPNATAGDFRAVITWGDGNTSAGTVTANAGGAFDVMGEHTYADEGDYEVTVTVLDAGGSSATAETNLAVTDALLAAHGTPVRAIEGSLFNGVVGTFTDANPAATTADFQAVIDWGDSTTSAGMVAANPAGGFDVLGSHRYAEEGDYAVNITVQDVGGASASASDDTEVADGPLSALATAVNATEGAPCHALVATFTDANPGATAADFTVTIAWGDGTTSAGAVTPNTAGGFDVTGDHTYLEDGAHAVGVTIQDAGSAVVSTSATVHVADAAIEVTGVPFVATEGATFSGSVATLTDANPNATPGEYTVTINWGDGTLSAGTVVANRSGGFDVVGSHQYRDEGTPVVRVAIHDLGTAVASTTTTGHVTDAALTVMGLSVQGIEGNSFSGTFATFTDANPFASTGDHVATIDWGDGTTSAGVVSLDMTGGFDVTSSHRYAVPGLYHAGVSVVDQGGSTGTGTSSIDVADAALLLTAGPTGLTRVAGAPSGDVIVANFTDANPLTTAGSYSAQINWGDGQTSPGVIQADGHGSYTVSGAHTYTTAGGYAVTVALSEAVGGRLAVTTSADVSTPSVAAPNTPLSFSTGESPFTLPREREPFLGIGGSEALAIAPVLITSSPSIAARRPDPPDGGGGDGVVPARALNVWAPIVFHDLPDLSKEVVVRPVEPDAGSSSLVFVPARPARGERLPEGMPSGEEPVLVAALPAAQPWVPQTEVLWRELDGLGKDLSSGAWTFGMSATVVAGFTLTVGYVAWNLRNWYLLAGGALSMPLWRQLDPLAVLDVWDKQRKPFAAGADDKDDEAELRPVFG